MLRSKNLVMDIDCAIFLLLCRRAMAAFVHVFLFASRACVLTVGSFKFLFSYVNRDPTQVNYLRVMINVVRLY